MAVGSSVFVDKALHCDVCLQASNNALHEAALSGHADVVAEMLRKGADHDLALPVSTGTSCMVL
jgi:ankyrin repeat protein